MHGVVRAGITQLDNNRRINGLDIDELTVHFLGLQRLCGNEQRNKKQRLDCVTEDPMKGEFLEKNPHIDLYLLKRRAVEMINALCLPRPYLFLQGAVGECEHYLPES